MRRRGAAEEIGGDTEFMGEWRELFQVTANNGDEFFSSFVLLGGRFAIWIKHVKAHMAFENLRHQRVDRTATGGQRQQDGPALGLVLQCLADRIDLATEAVDTVKQSFLAANCMSHAIESIPLRGMRQWQRAVSGNSAARFSPRRFGRAENVNTVLTKSRCAERARLKPTSIKSR